MFNIRCWNSSYIIYEGIFFEIYMRECCDKVEWNIYINGC